MTQGARVLGDVDLDVVGVGVAQRVGHRLAGDPEHVRGHQRRELRRPPAHRHGGAVGDVEVVGAGGQRLVQGAAVQWGSRLGQAGVHVGGRGLELDHRPLDGAVEPVGHLAVQRAD